MTWARVARRRWSGHGGGGGVGFAVIDRDLDGPLLYDIIINTDHLRPAEAAGLIVEAWKINATSVNARR